MGPAYKQSEIDNERDPAKKAALPGYGGIYVTDKNGYTTQLLYVDPSVKEGDLLVAGHTPLGTVQDLSPVDPGITNHVHLGISFGGRPFNPTPYLPPTK